MTNISCLYVVFKASKESTTNQKAILILPYNRAINVEYRSEWRKLLSNVDCSRITQQRVF